VFLLSRIHERWAATGDTRDAIVHGVASTARLITGAAAIIVVVFAGFATGQLVSFQQMGFGIAIALAIDATLVRLILIPAAMRLLGEHNWYLPRWLSWLPDLQVEGAPQPVGTDGKWTGAVVRQAADLSGAENEQTPEPTKERSS
jgi:putative drug exporter of the RND superfamily